jgi:hypothetical protein
MLVERESATPLVAGEPQGMILLAAELTKAHEYRKAPAPRGWHAPGLDTDGKAPVQLDCSTAH